MRERGLVLAHQVNDVTERLNGHLVALQGGDNDLPQLFDDTKMVRRGHGNIRECGHDLATEQISLLLRLVDRSLFLGHLPSNIDTAIHQKQACEFITTGGSVIAFKLTYLKGFLIINNVLS